MKKPAILIMAVTGMMIGILVLEFHLSKVVTLDIIPDDYSILIDTVSNQESKILLIGEELPFPESIQHDVLDSFDELLDSNIGQNDFIIIHASNNSTNHCFTTDQINILKSLNHRGVSIIFVGLSSYDFLNIDKEIQSSYPSGVGVIMMNPNTFDQGLYQIHAPHSNNLELRLYQVLRMMVPR
jgi:hypothetical protein